MRNRLMVLERKLGAQRCPKCGGSAEGDAQEVGAFARMGLKLGPASEARIVELCERFARPCPGCGRPKCDLRSMSDADLDEIDVILERAAL